MGDTGLFEGWDVITTNQNTRTIMDEQTLHDVITIINNLLLNFQDERFTKLMNDLLDHLENLDDPHHTTPEQLLRNVIDKIYELWLIEGNRGDLRELVEILFKYIPLATLEDLIEGLSEEMIATVNEFANFLGYHSISSMSHALLLDRFVVGEKTDIEPSWVMHYNIGHTLEQKEHLDTETLHLKKSPLHHDVIQDREVTWVFEMVLDRTLSGPQELIKLTCLSGYFRITLNNDNNMLSASIEDKFDYDHVMYSLDPDETLVTFVVTYDRERFTIETKRSSMGVDRKAILRHAHCIDINLPLDENGLRFIYHYPRKLTKEQITFVLS